MLELKAHFSRKTSEAESLRLSVEKAEGTLSAAKQLLDKLGGEKTRWGGQVGADMATACCVWWCGGEKTRWGGQVGADLATACCVWW